MAFKDRLKEARLKKGYTQEQIAEKVGIAKSTFTGYERGNSEPNMLTISKIMELLHVDANYLFQDEMGSNYPMKVSYDEYQQIEKYRSLDPHGKEMVDFTLQKEWERSTTIKNANICDFNPLPDAAHERTDISITDEMRKHDDDIMNEDNF